MGFQIRLAWHQLPCSPNLVSNGRLRLIGTAAVSGRVSSELDAANAVISGV
jgi:hypothetical protein